MAAGEVLLNGTQIGIPGTGVSSLANLLDGNALTYWSTFPGTTAWAGIDAGVPCQLTRVKLSTIGGDEDSVIGGIIQGASSSGAFGSVPAFIQGNFNAINASGNNSCPFTIANTAGNCIVVFVGSDATSLSVSDGTNTYTLIATFAGALHVYIATGIAAITANVTATLSGNTYSSVSILECSGVVSSSPLDVTNQASAGSGTASSVSVTTTQANDLLLCYIATGGTPTISPSSAGFGTLTSFGTKHKSGSANSSSTVIGAVAASTGVQTATATWTGSEPWDTLVIALKATTAGAPTSLLTITTRPVAGTLLNEYDFAPGASFRYYAFNSPIGNYGTLGDLDFYVTYVSGVTAAAVSPVITPATKNVDFPVVVRMSTTTTDATIFYTMDGTTPTSGSIQYGGPFVLSATCQLKAIAISPGLSNSRVTSAFFNVAAHFISTQNQYDNRNYKVWTVDPGFFFDPIGGYWWMYGVNFDQIGVKTQGLIGMNAYKSADLRNWIYAGVFFGPPAGQEINDTSLAVARPFMAYNTSTSLYVMWIESSVNTMQVYTSSSPGGPWTFVAGYSSFNGYTLVTDNGLFLDTDGVSLYIYSEDVATQSVFFSKLNSAWTNVDGVNFASYNRSVFNPQPPYDTPQTDGPHMFKHGSTYFFVSNPNCNWAYGQNRYATSTSPLGPWTDVANPFQVNASAPAANTLAYGSQNNYVIQIPGRNAWIMSCDAYNTGLANNVGSSPTTNFQAWTEYYLPITFPTSSTMSVNWIGNWTLDNVFPTISGAPAAATNLAITGNRLLGFTVIWTNNEPNPYSLYLDRSSSPAFPFSTVASEVLSMGTTSFSIASPLFGTTFYRVRTVNANGTTNSPAGSLFVDPNQLPPVVAPGTGYCVVLTIESSYQVEYLTSGVDYSQSITVIESGPYGDYVPAFQALWDLLNPIFPLADPAEVPAPSQYA